MSISLTTKAFLYIALPQVVEVAKDIVESKVTDENLGAIKAKLYEAAKGITGKTHFTWDDDLAIMLLDAFGKPEIFAKVGDALLDPIEEWIAHSATKYDDQVVLPIIEVFRKVAGIPDGEE